MPAVSVVVITFNRRDLVQVTLASVFAQTFDDYEVIVVDDGSSDDTSEALRPLAESGRIRYVRQANAGQPAARNAGLAQAKGEFVAFLDDDDLWPADKLQWQVDLLRESPQAVMVYGFAEMFGGYFNTICPGPDAPTGQVREAMLSRNVIASPGQTLMRVAAVRQIGGFDRTILGGEDWDLYIRLSAIGEFRYAHRMAMRYRIHPASVSKNLMKMYDNMMSVRRKHFGSSPRPAERRAYRACGEYIREYVTQNTIHQAENAMVAGRYVDARRLWISVLRLRPLEIRKGWWWKKMVKATFPARFSGPVVARGA